MTYAWEYMMKTEPRGKQIYEIIAPYIADCRSVLDMNCGPAPLYPYLAHLDYVGFDNSETCIARLRAQYPEGHWLLCDDKDFPTQAADLLLLLGLVNGKHPLDSRTQNESFMRLVQPCKIAIIERSQFMSGLGREIGCLDAGFENHHRHRVVELYVK